MKTKSQRKSIRHQYRESFMGVLSDSEDEYEEIIIENVTENNDEFFFVL